MVFRGQNELVFAFGVMARLAAAQNVAVGDFVSVEGYVMDRLCIDRGTLLDNEDIVTLEGPYEHSIHCLVDIGSCAQGPFEILTDPYENSSQYVRAYEVDDAARVDLVRLARQVGNCNTCSKDGLQRKGFRAFLNGTVTELGENGLPHKLEVSSMEVVEVMSGTNNALTATVSLTVVLLLLGF